ncbi:hypothetical protein LCGC14_0939080 [marine sediment metagenome]|uniref:Uncharacterized protein n=1 Tax=marine sediment metagenome TaxID=412755 RepID=A0A0F9NKM4_9ZZZZ
MENKIRLSTQINPELLHEEIKALYPGFTGLVIGDGMLTAISDTGISDLADIVEAHDPEGESTREIALRLDREAIEALELTITTEADPMLVLEARIARIEALLQVRLE